MRVGKIPVVSDHANIATPDQAAFLFIYQLSTDGSLYCKKSNGTTFPVVGGSYISTLNCSLDPNYPAASKGDKYLVSVAGRIGGGAGKVVQVGDIIVAWADNAGGDEAAVGADWNVEQGNLEKASTTETSTGTDDAKYTTPATVAYALQVSKANYAVQVGADINAIVAATTPATTVPANGRQIILRKTALVNDNAVTLDVGTGAVNVVKTAKDGTEVALVANDMPPGDYMLTFSTSGGNKWILSNPAIPDRDITGNASTATLAANATGQKPTYATYGGSAVGSKVILYQSDTTPGSANNPAVVGAAGAFSVTVGTLVGSVQMRVHAVPAGGTASIPVACSGMTFNSGTGEITGVATIWDVATKLFIPCVDGTRVQVEFIGVAP